MKITSNTYTLLYKLPNHFGEQFGRASKAAYACLYDSVPLGSLTHVPKET
jgi:hypothetical protein